MRVAALIIGINGWEQYTRPLMRSIQQHNVCDVVIIDNASPNQYPALPWVHRTERLCYSAAINRAHAIAGPHDWYVVLSNDVLCTGNFTDTLAALPANSITGPCLKEAQGYSYLEGWCVCIPAGVWDTLGGWDENFQVSSWEDVDFTQTALEHEVDVIFDDTLPFVHLDQRQRFTLVENYWDSENHNVRYFLEKRRAAA